MKIQTVHVLRYPYSRVGSGTGAGGVRWREVSPQGLFTSMGAMLGPPGSWSHCVHSEKARRAGADIGVLFSLGHGLRMF